MATGLGSILNDNACHLIEVFKIFKHFFFFRTINFILKCQEQVSEQDQLELVEEVKNGLQFMSPSMVVYSKSTATTQMDGALPFVLIAPIQLMRQQRQSLSVAILKYLLKFNAVPETIKLLQEERS